jgi:hypothetical protein
MSSNFSDDLYFWVKRAYSPVGFFAASIFALLYLVPLAAASRDSELFDLCMAMVGKFPLYFSVEVVFAAFFVCHFILAFVAIYSSSINIASYVNHMNAIYSLRRIAGVLIIPFMIYHIVAARLSPALSGRCLSYANMKAVLAHGWTQWFYVVGMSFVAFFAASSLMAIMIEWGLLVSMRARNAAAVIMWSFVLLVSLWSFKIVMFF